MADPTADFFDRLARHGAPQFGTTTATIRIDLDRGNAIDHRLITVDRGQIRISSSDVNADAVLHTDPELFDRLVQGDVNPVVSLLRGLWQAEGDTELIVLFQGLFPAPTNSRSYQVRAHKEEQPA
jgi:putative sterol carrier protein